ncbi:hypothetical protein N8Z24_00805 [bacterium]|nr:hypothetical protein [bacterium]
MTKAFFTDIFSKPIKEAQMKLKNINHGFDTEVGEIGCTIRKGDKYTKIPIGTTFELYDCPTAHKDSCGWGCTKQGKGLMLGHWCGPWKDVPESLMKIEHNIKARDRAVCEQMLKVGYGSIDPDDTVTAVIYLRTEK